MRRISENKEVEQKSGTLEQAGLRYGFGRNTMRKLAAEAGAIIKWGKCVRVNYTIMDTYIDSLTGE